MNWDSQGEPQGQTALQEPFPGQRVTFLSAFTPGRPVRPRMVLEGAAGPRTAGGEQGSICGVGLCPQKGP